ncbi:MAG TPA: hypothetical protein VLJ17_24225 [Xanthobacteraceae bacterium]|nr:hypothetical protein [Xanthobacteraceae bacterium]
MGLDGEKLFFSLYHMQLVDDSDELAALDSALDDVPESNLSEYVLKKLNPYKRVIGKNLTHAQRRSPAARK